MRQPGWSRWKRNAVSPRRASSEVRASRMKCSATPAPGDEPLVAVDHPGVAFLLRARADHVGIGAAAGRGLGHGEGGAHLAVDDGPQPFVLLRRRAHQREQIHVAVVGRGAVERERPEDRTIRFLVHRGPADDRQRHAAVRLRRLRRPQALGPGLGLHAAQARRGGCSRARRNSPRRLRAAAHARSTKRARAQADVFDLGRQREVHASVLINRGRRPRSAYPRNATIWPPSTTMVVPAM